MRGPCQIEALIGGRWWPLKANWTAPAIRLDARAHVQGRSGAQQAHSSEGPELDPDFRLTLGRVCSPQRTRSAALDPPAVDDLAVAQRVGPVCEDAIDAGTAVHAVLAST